MLSPSYWRMLTVCRNGLRVLIFNQQGRTEAVSFLDAVQRANRRDASRPAFDHVVFCTNVTYAQAGYKRDFVNRGVDPNEVASMAAQKRFADKWAELDPLARVVLLPTIEEALDYARYVAGDSDLQVQAYVTGSLHLVGGALGILEKADAL